MPSPKQGYASLRLHGLSAAAWAVISLSTGAIATDDDNRLLMRLTETEANRIADAMTNTPAKQNSSDEKT